MNQSFTTSFKLLFLFVMLSTVASAQGKLGIFDTTYYNSKGLDLTNTTGGLVLPDSSIIVVGKFTFVNQRAINGIVKLTPSGEIDYSFNPGTGADDFVNTVVRQPDGKLIIGGNFIKFNGQTKNRIARLNADGSLDPTFNIGGTGCNQSVYSIYQQPDGKILLGGHFSIYNGDTLGYFVRLNNNGSRDTSFHVGKGFTYDVYSIDRQADGQYIVAGDFIKYKTDSIVRIARIDTTGNLDTTFNYKYRRTGANGIVTAAYLLPNGKIVAAGFFGSYDSTFSPGIARILPDGKYDSSFVVGTGFSNNVNEICFEPNGKIIATGNFTTYAGVASPRIIRIDTTGLKDVSFNPGTGLNLSSNTVFMNPDGKIYAGGTFEAVDSFTRIHFARLLSTGKVDHTFFRESKLNAAILGVGFQSSGKAIVVGSQTKYNEVSSNRITRLNLDGSLDQTFSSGTGANGIVRCIVVLPNDKILIGGDFTSYNGTVINRIARLNANGTLDNTFTVGTGANVSIYGMALLPNGKIVITGTFTTYNGVGALRIARLNSSGTLDNTFVTGTGLNAQGTDLAIQADGKIIVGGLFTLYNGTTRNRIVRIDTLGAVDSTYANGTGANNAVSAVVLQPNGQAIIAGAFTTYNGATKAKIARLKLDGTLDSTYVAAITGAGQVNDMAYLRSAAFFTGGLVIAGSFVSVDNVAQARLSYLDDNGFIDSVNFYKGTGLVGTLLTATFVNTVAINYFDRKLFLGGDFVGLHTHSANRVAAISASSIAFASIHDVVLCPGATTSIYFSRNQTFFGNNLFQVQLSDSTGNFSNPVNIGSLSEVNPGSDSIQVTIPANTPFGTNYQVRVISTNPGDTSNLSQTITIGNPILPVVTVTGPIVFCLGVNTVLTSSVADHYLWSTGDTTQSITVDQTNSYTVTVSTANCVAGSAPVNIIAKPSPDTTIAVAYSLCGGNTANLTASANNTYAWSTTETTRAISVSANGNYAVTLTGTNGCSVATAVAVNLDSVFNNLISAAGSTTFCQGGSVTLSSQSGLSYAWSNGATSLTTSVNATGDYDVTVSDGVCFDTSSIIHITVNPLPVLSLGLPSDTVCNNGGAITLTATPSGGTFSGNQVSGNSFNPTTLGNNNVVLTYAYTDSNTCSNTKNDSVYVAICTGVEEVFANATLLYPNPAKENLFISTTENSIKNVEVFNLLGEKVLFFTEPTNTNYLTLNISSLSAGNYFVKAGEKKFRFVKE